jgi:ATP-dependent helicase Lhr and Lhr-like helicase
MTTPPTPDALSGFHPVIQRWFASAVGCPTAVQREAWPLIAAGKHVLAVAPTGSGKTLAAFLWALDRLLVGAWPAGALRVLYVSPLKALGYDVQRNLLAPLSALAAAFTHAGLPPPEIQVLTRTGDTPPEERQRMRRRPPEILITTPESLNILLTSRRGRQLLAGLRSVILDEVHAVIGGKRGVHLITAVERLVPLAGDVQRIALSATVRPLERVAAWVGGSDGDAPRSVAIARDQTPKAYELSVHYPPAETPSGTRDPWPALIDALRPSLETNRSTLVFANSRRLVEKLARLANEDMGTDAIYAHHGSLAREIRSVVEERFKRGELRAVAATSSLELGIDIGTLDEVLLVETPPSVAAAIQRAGRAGHAVGQVSRARFLPLVPLDLVESAVVARALREGAIEATQPMAGPLDVLAQIVVSMVAGETWSLDELHALLRRTAPYHDLSRTVFDLVLDLLAGRFASRRLRALDPLVYVDRQNGTVRGLPGAERRVYLAGGTIPDRGAFQLRIAETGALLGELDEEFVWERSVGDSFTLGVQSWRIERITHNDVVVTPSHKRAAMAPFWRADERWRPFELAERCASFLEEAESRLADPAFLSYLMSEHALTEPAARELLRFLSEQQEATGVLPHRHRIVVERVRQGDEEQLLLHTLWGGRVNVPLALALVQAWARTQGTELSIMQDDNCLIVSESQGIDAARLLRLVTPENVTDLLRAQLPQSGIFGARFREAAVTSLLLPRAGFQRRTPLWLTRQRAKELLASVAGIQDFPLFLEAWRACMQDAFDLDALRTVLTELTEGRIAVHEVETDRPSPFASGVQWKRTNALMYADDTPATGGLIELRPSLLSEVAQSPHLRPRLAPALAETLRLKLQRSHAGYAPRTMEELLSVLEERCLMPLQEWSELCEAIDRAGDLPPDWRQALAGRLVRLEREGPAPPLLVAKAGLARLLAAGVVAIRAQPLMTPDGEPLTPALAEALDRDAENAAPNTPPERLEELIELTSELLRFYGPVPQSFIAETFGIDDDSTRGLVAALADAGRAIVGELTLGATAVEVCDSENMERLLRLARAQGRSSVQALPIERLPLFLATWQGLARDVTETEADSTLRDGLERLFGYPAPADLWESDILPARLSRYQPAWLDRLFRETDLAWIGCDPGRLFFALDQDRHLVTVTPGEGAADMDLSDLLPPDTGRHAFDELLRRTGLPSAELSHRIWGLAWRGLLTSDGFAAVRQGIATGFAPVPGESLGGTRRRPPRSSFSRWRGARPFDGAWRRLDPALAPADPIEEDERQRDSARLVLARYGVVFRELLERELPNLSWGRLWRSLRLMELSGEVATGQFFQGIGGLQFATPAAVQLLRDGLPDDSVFWFNACDPVSPCGLALADGTLGPRRVPSNHLVLDGSSQVIVSQQNGRRLSIAVAPDHPRLPLYLGLFETQLTRPVRPQASITVESINEQTATTSGYRQAFESLFHVVREQDALRLLRRY